MGQRGKGVPPVLYLCKIKHNLKTLKTFYGPKLHTKHPIMKLDKGMYNKIQNAHTIEILFKYKTRHVLFLCNQDILEERKTCLYKLPVSENIHRPINMIPALYFYF